MFRVVFYVYQRSNQWNVENQHTAPVYFPTGSCEKLKEAGTDVLDKRFGKRISIFLTDTGAGQRFDVGKPTRTTLHLGAQGARPEEV